MALAAKIGVALAGLLTSMGLLFFGTLDRVAAGGMGASTGLVESPACAARSDLASTPTGAPGAPGGALQQTIAVTVPATSILRIDPLGRITAALTNTGCAPRASDDVYVTQPDGSLALAPSKTIVQRIWTGDFTSPGVYVPQRG